MGDKVPILKCPHCGNDEEFYMRYTWKDVIGVIDNQGNFVEENFESAHVVNGNIIYCANCDKQVMRKSRLEKLKGGFV